MDTKKLDRHAEQFGALGHPARLSLLRLIVQAGAEGMSTTQLQGKLDLPWTTLNHHLSRLVSAGLPIERRVHRHEERAQGLSAEAVNRAV